MLRKGSTSQASDAPILGAKYWKKGTTISGTVTRMFPTATGNCYEIKLSKPFAADGQNFERVSLGNLKGLSMALQACGLEHFEVGDKVIVKCTGSTPTGKGNPRVNFEVEVER